MRAKIIQEGLGEPIARERTLALIFETGEEVIAALTDFATERSLTACHFTAIGAFSEVTLGFFDWERKAYKRIPIREQVEVISLLGDITLHHDKPTVHAHVVLGKSDGTAHGGHLMQGRVRPTLELILTELPSYLQRKVDEESGLALIDIEATAEATSSERRRWP